MGRFARIICLIVLSTVGCPAVTLARESGQWCGVYRAAKNAIEDHCTEPGYVIYYMPIPEPGSDAKLIWLRDGESYCAKGVRYESYDPVEWPYDRLEYRSIKHVPPLSPHC